MSFYLPGVTTLLRSGLIAVVAFLCISTAQETLAQTANPETYSFAVEAGSVDQALASFGRQVGVLVAVSGNVSRDKQSQGLSGAYSIAQGLEILLRGTGLEAVRQSNGSYVVRAASNQRTGPLVLAPIQVKGELLERTLQDSQTSVAVVLGDSLERRADPDLFSVFERTAGVALGSGGERIIIRGVQEGGFGGGAPVITKRIDGSIVSFGRFSFNALESTWDLEQVEVLRGPQSTQSGRNTLAGAVEIRSKDPEYDPAFKVRAEVGNGDSTAGAFAANLPLVEDTLALRVSLDRERTDGFVDNTTLGVDDFDRGDQTTFRTSLRWDPDDNFSAILKYTHMNSDSSGNGPEIQGAEFPRRRISLANVRDTEDVKRFNAGNLRLTYRINESFSLQSETTYSESRTLTTLDFDKSPADAGVFVNDQSIKSIEQELRLNYNGRRTKAVVGAFFANDDSSSPQGSTLPANVVNPLLPPGLTITAVLEPSSDSTNYAVFGEAEVALQEQLTLIIGGRYDDQEVKTANVTDIEVSDPAFAPFLPGSSTSSGETDFGVFLPKLGLVYEFTPDTSLGFTVQRGYRAGGIEIDRITGAETEFDPEFTWNYELALRMQSHDGRWLFNANAFYTDWEDQQIAVPGPTGNPLDFRTANAGSSRLFGGELDFQFRVTEDFDLFASFGYADTKFQDFGADTGNEFPFAAEYTAALGGTYYFLEQAYISLDGSYQSEAFSDTGNTASRKTDSRFLVNVQVGYDAEHWSVILFANNLFDKDYITNVQNAALGRQGIVNAGPPRVFGVIGQWNF
ncbi:MAG: TonB-dependent receptor [Pseudomonadota bacterium]